MTKQLAELPTSAVAELKELRGNDSQQFHELVFILRKEGWPLRAIAGPLGVSRSAVRNWETKIHTPVNRKLPVEYKLPPSTFGQGHKIVKIPHDLKEEDRVKIYLLAQEAKKKTRWSEPDSAEYKASQELEDLIVYYIRRKVPVATIARHMGVTRRAVAQRLEKINV